MKTYFVIGAVVILVGVTGLLYQQKITSLWRWWLGKKNCDAGGWLWDDTCTFLLEKYLKKDIPQPIHTYPTLLAFSMASGAGKPIHKRMWYRIRLIDPKTGAYSNYGPWSLLPVYAGACNLPCPSGSCSSAEVPTGKQTCLFNNPTIGILASHIPTGYVANLHRYVDNSTNDDTTQPPLSVESECVGAMLFKKSFGGTSYYIFNDVAKNPCNKVACPVIGVCTGKKSC